jgi:hypothetical protein
VFVVFFNRLISRRYQYRTQPFDVRLDKDEIGSADLLFSVNPVRDLEVNILSKKK